MLPRPSGWAQRIHDLLGWNHRATLYFSGVAVLLSVGVAQVIHP